MLNHEVDWEDAPLPYKLYRNLPIIPLSLEIPLSLPNSSTTPTLDEIGHYLWCSFGLTQLCQLNSEKILFRRSIPSGGALYPNELYIYLKLTIIRRHLPLRRRASPTYLTSRRKFRFLYYRSTRQSL